MLKIGEQPISIHNVYGPNVDGRNFFQTMETRLFMDNTPQKLVGGDLNAVINCEEDRRGAIGGSGVQRSQSSPLTPLLSNCHLIDAWRSFHPDSREYTHFSHPHNSWSRIDYVLLTPLLLQRVESVQIEDMVISDHSPVILQMTDILPRGKDYLWRFPTYLAQDEEFRAVLRGWWLDYTATHVDHISSPGLYWETAKVVLRGHIMAFTSKLKRQVRDKIYTLGQTLRQAYTHFQSQPNEDAKAQWCSAKTEYDAWLERGEGFRRTQQEAKLFRYGNKAGRLLANFAKGMRPTSHIKSLRDSQGELQHTPDKINDILKDFYRDLYAREGPMTGSPDHWLTNPALPTLTEEERELLGGPIIQEELERAISNLKTQKAPGPDGYSGEFFKLLRNDISPTLTQLFNSFLQGAPIPRFLNLAHIKVLPKAGKDLSLPASYRPISLINVDLKLM